MLTVVGTMSCWDVYLCNITLVINHSCNTDSQPNVDLAVAVWAINEEVKEFLLAIWTPDLVCLYGKTRVPLYMVMDMRHFRAGKERYSRWLNIYVPIFSCRPMPLQRMTFFFFSQPFMKHVKHVVGSPNTFNWKSNGSIYIWEKGHIGNFARHEICCEMWNVSSQIWLQRNYPFKCCKSFENIPDRIWDMFV